MAYNTKELEKRSIEAIKAEKLVFIEQIVTRLPCDKTTFYAHNLHESNAIREELNKNIVARKEKLRGKWEDSDNPALQMGLYRLLGTDDEVERLNGTKHKHEHDHTVKSYEIITTTESKDRGKS